MPVWSARAGNRSSSPQESDTCVFAVCFGFGGDRQSGGKIMAFAHKLYAVVSHKAQPSPTRKSNVLELRAQKLHEIETKRRSTEPAKYSTSWKNASPTTRRR